MKALGLLILMINLSLGAGNPEQSNDTNQLIEEMKIVAVRIPVRVYHKGNCVDGLTIKDFKIFEGDEEKTVEGFTIIKRSVKGNIQKNSQQIVPSRLFVMVFKITHFNPPLEEAVDYICSNILRRGDELLLFTNYQTKGYILDNDIKGIREKIKEVLKSDSKRVRLLGETYISKLKKLVSDVKYRMVSDPSFHQSNVILFLDEYMQIWWEFKRNYLTPNLKTYINFAHFLSKVKKEKWVIDFFQMQLFPQFKKTGDLLRTISVKYAAHDDHWSKKIKDQLHELEMEFRAPVRFPSEEVSELFYNVDTTFHSIFIPSTSRMINQDLDYQVITTEIETSLRKITKKTGGRLTFSGNIKESIQEIEEVEDIQYILFFTPNNLKAIKKVTVEVINPDYELAYSNNRNPDYIKKYVNELKENLSSLKIARATFSGRSLYLNISGLNIKNQEQKGMALVRIKAVLNKNNECLYDQQKTIVTKEGKDSFALNMNFDKLPAGGYTFIFEAKDLITKHNISKILEVDLK